MNQTDTTVPTHSAAPQAPQVYVPPTRAQFDFIERILLDDGDARRAAALLRAASLPEADQPPRLWPDAEPDEIAAIRALRLPAHRDLPAALLRIARAIDSETEGLYHRKDTGDPDAAPALRAIGFLLLELGFTVAEEAGIDCDQVQIAIAQAYELPGYVDTPIAGLR